jgi:flagellar basal body-associated protein FliL
MIKQKAKIIMWICVVVNVAFILGATVGLIIAFVSNANKDTDSSLPEPCYVEVDL